MGLLSLVSVLAVLLSVLSILVNKYVLSVLLFTYPALFQGWQCALVVLCLLVSSYHQHGHLSIPATHDIANCLPSATAFSLSIYSGSRALQQLSVIVYCSLAGIVDTIMAVADAFIQGRPSVMWLLPLASMQLLSIFLLLYADVDISVNWNGYLWMGVSCVSACLSRFLRKLTPGTSAVEDAGRAVVDHVISVVLLLLYSFASRQAVTAWDFTHKYNTRFHAGLVGSGLLCGFFATVKLKLSSQSVLSVILGMRILASLLSLVLFKDALSVAQTAWILASFMCVLVLGLFERRDLEFTE